MAAAQRLICEAAVLQDGGMGVRFEVDYGGARTPAFVVRHEGRVYGFLNRCAHVAMELDWNEGRFFDFEGRDLICSTHGAVYAASSGRCLGGPCGGAPLVRLAVEEREGRIYYLGVADG
jgi:nitrite reductase/ring-hydroxylating ferredoxin subunit